MKRRLHARHLTTPPGERTDPFAASEDMAEVCLITEATLQADLRQAQVSEPDQLLGASDALGADPVLWRESGTAFERPGKMTA
jgi:hypothetical protein